MKIGVLALQGDFLEHCLALEKLKVEAPPVRLPQELAGLDGLIIPGGESTTIGRLLAEFNLYQSIKDLASQGVPIWGTCAGMILLAKRATDLSREPLGLMDIEVRRNAFGRQVDSFETDLAISTVGENPFHAIFIRAPLIERTGPGVDVLARLPSGEIVAARQKTFLATAFHPELGRDLRFHAYFLNMVATHERGQMAGPPPALGG